MIIARNRPLRDITGDAVVALRAANEPPELFVRAGALARFRRDEQTRPIIESVTPPMIRARLARVANWRTFDARSKKMTDIPPSSDVVEDVLALGQWPFPPLIGITESPILRPDGSILDREGYDGATHLVYAPASTLVMPPIPDAPTVSERAQALDCITDLLADFPFVDRASKANALGLLITQSAQAAIDGQKSLALIDKPTPGSVASLLAEVISIVASGRPPGMSNIPRTDEEMEKRITTLLRDGETLVVFDNVDRPLDHSSLSLALTANEWAGRVLGRSEQARYPNGATWIVTGNNMSVRGDVARRSYWIRLDAKESQPWRRTGFRHPNLLAWASQHRGELVGAALTLCRAWIAVGRPIANVPRIGKFEAWCITIGSILAHAGVVGFLENLDQLYEQVDDEGPQWERFLRVWQSFLNDRRITTTELARKVGIEEGAIPVLAEALPDELAEAVREGKGSFPRKFGKALAKREGRRYGHDHTHLERAGTDSTHGRPLWRVVSDVPHDSPVSLFTRFDSGTPCGIVSESMTVEGARDETKPGKQGNRDSEEAGDGATRCPVCSGRWDGTTCWGHEDRLCVECGDWTGRVFVARCTTCSAREVAATT